MTRFYRCLFVLMCLTIVTVIWGQQSQIDSLQAIRNPVDKLHKMELDLRLAELYKDVNLDTALLYVNVALEVCLSTKGEDCLFQVLNKKSEIELSLGQYAESLQNMRRASAISLNQNDSSKMAECNDFISYIYEMRGMYDSAMVFAINGLAINEQIDNESGIAQSYRNLAVLQLYTGNYDKALEYNRNALEIYTRLKKPGGMAMIYINTGNTFYYLNEYDSTLWYYAKGLEIAEKLGDLEGKATLLHNMGVVSMMQENYDQAEAYHIESLALRTKLGIQDHISLSYSSMGALYEYKKEYKKAETHYKKSIEIGKLIGARERLQESYVGLAEVEFALKNYKSAYENLQLYIQQKDSLLTEKKAEQIASLEIQYEAEKKQAAIDILMKDAEIKSLALQRQRYQRNGLLVLFVLLSLIAYGLYRRNEFKQRVKKEKEEKEKALHDERAKTEFERQKVEQLEKVDKLKDAFLANTSHELRTPLHGIIGLAQSMAERPQNQKDLDDLEMIIYSGNRLASLVNDILDFSKLKTHTIKLEQRAVDLNSVVDLVMHVMKPLIGDKKVTLKKDISTNLPRIAADENRIQQILLNLIGNAIKFSHQGDITIAAKQNGDMMEISIADHGVGIPVEELERIFNSFTQLEDSRQRHYEGSGLGLSIAQQLVNLHGGELSASSKVGEGSVFKFTIPCATSDHKFTEEAALNANLSRISKLETSQSRTNTEMHLTDTENAYHILVVDDDPVNQQVLKNYLAGDEFVVTQAMNGEEAMAAISQRVKFDVVLLDIMMPGMSGYEVCEKIRTYYLPSELPVLMVTAKNQMDDLVEAFSLQANDYLVKPISKPELLARLGTHLNLLHINQSYNRFIPKELFTFLGRDNILDVKLGDQIQENATVLFSDIRSFTELSESMKVSDNFQLLNGYLSRVVPVINSHQGLVHQFLGDGILALFLKAPEHAIHASIAYHQMLAGYNDERISKNRIPLKIGIGINTGPLMLGIIGDNDRQGAIVVSDTVNATSRLEGLTKQFGVSIVVGEDTMELLPHRQQFRHRRLGKVLVKGKKNAMDIYDFYDGDSADLIAKKDNSKEAFEEALSRYEKQEFEEALLLFKKVIEINPSDMAAIRYQSNAAHFIVQGVSKDWTGIERIDVK